MCGRFALSPITNKVDKLLPNAADITLDVIPRYNICPGNMVKGIIYHDDYRIGDIHWGLAPYPNRKGFIVNARCESLKTKVTYSGLHQRKRILIPATGYYEWMQIDKSRKIPYYFSLPENPLFALGGIYDIWNDENGEKRSALAIITTPANEAVESVHHRMPLILDSSNASDFLNPLIDIEEFFNPYRNSNINITEASLDVNNPKNDGLYLINNHSVS
jgi:putative SOS response-associated peptidase YedK